MCPWTETFSHSDRLFAPPARPRASRHESKRQKRQQTRANREPTSEMLLRRVLLPSARRSSRGIITSPCGIGMRQFHGDLVIMQGATVEGTSRFCREKFPITATASLSRSIPTRTDQWTIVPVGFGAYRTGHIDRDHQFALQYAIQNGCNVIDTSTNYEEGESEIMIGDVIAGMVSEGIVERDQIVVVTKVGYLQGANLDNVRDRMAEAAEQEGEGKEEQEIYRNVVRVQEEKHWHSIDPQFIHDQLTESLERLNMPTVDVLLLHNPEHVWSEEDTLDSFYGKIANAFEQLEREVDAGRIQRYGISSNTFPLDPNARGNVSLERCLEIARSLRQNHHFDFVEFPFNILEDEAYTVKRYDNGTKNLIEFAHANNLCCLGNRPLNAMDKRTGSVYRFADAHSDDPQSIFTQLQQMLEKVIMIEQQFPDQRYCDLPEGDPDLPTNQSMHWGHIIMSNLERFDTLPTWKVALEHQIRPDIDEAMMKLRSHPKSENFTQWIGNYRYMTNQLFSTYTKFLQFKQAQEVKEMKEHLDNQCAELTASGTLSQKAIHVLTSTGMDCTLVGMRRIEYVKDIVLNMKSPLEANAVDTVLKSTEWNPIPIVQENALPQQQQQQQQRDTNK